MSGETPNPSGTYDPDTYRPSIPRLSLSQTFTGDRLDHVKGNWKGWSQKMTIALGLNRLKGYVSGTIP